MNYEAQLDAARNAELNRYLDWADGLDVEEDEVVPKYTTHRFLHEINGELLTCVMTLNDQDEEDVRCSWYSIGPDPVLRYTNETAPLVDGDLADIMAYNTWYDQQTYQRTLKAA